MSDQKEAQEDESSETLREEFTKAIAGKSRFCEATKSGRAVVIVGYLSSKNHRHNFLSAN
jgi:hypothetical protein